MLAVDIIYRGHLCQGGEEGEGPGLPLRIPVGVHIPGDGDEVGLLSRDAVDEPGIVPPKDGPVEVGEVDDGHLFGDFV